MWCIVWNICVIYILHLLHTVYCEKDCIYCLCDMSIQTLLKRPQATETPLQRVAGVLFRNSSSWNVWLTYICLICVCNYNCTYMYIYMYITYTYIILPSHFKVSSCTTFQFVPGRWCSAALLRPAAHGPGVRGCSAELSIEGVHPV